MLIFFSLGREEITFSTFSVLTGTRAIMVGSLGCPQVACMIFFLVDRLLAPLRRAEAMMYSRTMAKKGMRAA